MRRADLTPGNQYQYVPIDPRDMPERYKTEKSLVLTYIGEDIDSTFMFKDEHNGAVFLDIRKKVLRDLFEYGTPEDSTKPTTPRKKRSDAGRPKIPPRTRVAARENDGVINWPGNAPFSFIELYKSERVYFDELEDVLQRGAGTKRARKPRRRWETKGEFLARTLLRWMTLEGIDVNDYRTVLPGREHLAPQTVGPGAPQIQPQAAPKQQRTLEDLIFDVDTFAVRIKAPESGTGASTLSESLPVGVPMFQDDTYIWLSFYAKSLDECKANYISWPKEG